MATRDGYCEHGKWVGGCGPDIMCHWCESGVSVEDLPSPPKQDCDGCWTEFNAHVLTEIVATRSSVPAGSKPKVFYTCDDCTKVYVGSMKWRVR